MPPDSLLQKPQNQLKPPGIDTGAVTHYLNEDADSSKSTDFNYYIIEDANDVEGGGNNTISNDVTGTLTIFLGLLILSLCGVYYKNRSSKGVKFEGDDQDRLVQMDSWLSKYNPYYHSLSPKLKELFLQRTLNYMGSKTWRFHSMKPEEYIPVLISGAAVQLTFGLKNYMMDHFEVIHVIRKEYYIPRLEDIYHGHVSPTGIHVAWNHFLHGYADYTDSLNIGLHEMAHALQYDVYLGYPEAEDRKFRQRLEKFAKEGKDIFRGIRSGKESILDDYATTNFDEFWAVSVETFFENPAEFKAEMPELYWMISDVLNQDPVTNEKVIEIEKM